VAVRDRQHAIGVLAIDDERSVREAMTLALAPFGYDVTACESLDDALRVLDARPLHVDIVIADLRLRGAASGLAAIAALRARLGAVPALVVSGDSAPELVDAVAAAGVRVLRKPASAKALRSAILDAIASN
jgi:two-component system, sensor histidine kinase